MAKTSRLLITLVAIDIALFHAQSAKNSVGFFFPAFFFSFFSFLGFFLSDLGSSADVIDSILTSATSLAIAVVSDSSLVSVATSVILVISDRASELRRVTYSVFASPRGFDSSA